MARSTHFGVLVLAAVLGVWGCDPSAPASDAAGMDSGGDASGICFVDPPCVGPYQCVTATSYANVETRDCHFLCGPGPCSGAYCVSTSSVPIACPAGEVCISHFVPSRACGPPGTGQDAGPDASVDAAASAPADAATDAAQALDASVDAALADSPFDAGG